MSTSSTPAPFCATFKSSALSQLNDANSLKASVPVWNTYANQAPPEIKSQAQQIAKYVDDLANGNYSEVAQMAKNLPVDVSAIATYYSAHCHT